MPDYKRYGIAAATLATILATGQLMQATAANKRASAADVSAMPLPVELSDIELTAADQETLVTAALDEGAVEAPLAPAPQASECNAELAAMPKAAALVGL